MSELEAEICLRHQKRKRCLALAKMCWERRWRPEFDYAFWHNSLAKSKKGGK